MWVLPFQSIFFKYRQWSSLRIYNANKLSSFFPKRFSSSDDREEVSDVWQDFGETTAHNVQVLVKHELQRFSWNRPARVILIALENHLEKCVILCNLWLFYVYFNCKLESANSFQLYQSQQLNVAYTPKYSNTRLNSPPLNSVRFWSLIQLWCLCGLAAERVQEQLRQQIIGWVCAEINTAWTWLCVAWLCWQIGGNCICVWTGS